MKNEDDNESQIQYHRSLDRRIYKTDIIQNFKSDCSNFLLFTFICMITDKLFFHSRSNFSALIFFIWGPQLLHQTQILEPLRQRAFDKQQVATHRYDMFV